MKNVNIFIITGLSGSGKSSALNALEDAGYYCVDNLPIALFPKFLEIPIESNFELAGFAFGMDMREKRFISSYKTIFDELREKGYHFEILFMEAEEKILVQRFSQTRRTHPLGGNMPLIEGIRFEREQLKDLRQGADRIIDTSRLNVHQLKSLILEISEKTKSGVRMRIHVLSFGFKYGVPMDADILIDVRFIQNPFFIPGLKEFDGETQTVKEFVINREETQVFLEKYLDLLDYLIPLYEKEGKVYLTIAVGCTGGRHRSVAVARNIYTHIQSKGRQLKISHRDIGQLDS